MTSYASRFLATHIGMSVVILTLAAAPAVAQNRSSQLERQIEARQREERRKALESTQLPRPSRRQYNLDYGAWLTSSFYTFDDTDPAGKGKDRTFRNNDIRLWSSLKLTDAHEFYARGRTAFVDYNPGDAFDANEDDYTPLTLDQAYWNANVLGLLGSTTEKVSPFGDARQIKAFSLKGTIGRQYFYLGSGMTLSRVLDGGRVDFDFFDYDIELFAARTVTNEDDHDRSISSPESSHRFFQGVNVSLKWAALGTHRPYVFFFHQGDFNHANAEDVATYPIRVSRFDYNSTYSGIGSTGGIPGIATSAYTFEVVFESGTTRSDPARQQANGKDRIEAWAVNASAEYFLPETRLSPRFLIGYLYGSGDSDRASVTNTLGGNYPDTVDRGFIGFGFVETGYALAPTLSNLHILKGTIACRPFKDLPGQQIRLLKETKRYLQEMELTGSYYFFLKDRKEGAISDFRAVNNDEQIVGNEFDLAMYWRVLSDISVGLQYGSLFQGQAYARRDVRHYLSASVTYNF